MPAGKARGRINYEEEFTMLETGTMAPDFTLPDKDGRPVSLSDYRGKKVIVYFYPKDSTPGCTKQAQGYQALYEQLQAAGVEVLGISRDSQKSHQKFAEKYGLTFPLLSDPERLAIEPWQVWVLKKLYGKESMGIQRSSFVVDENGVLIRVSQNCKSALDPQQTAEFLGIEP